MATQEKLKNVGNGIFVNFHVDLVKNSAVYAGTLDGETVAVKMISPGMSEFGRKEREIENMMELVNHTNTVQYKASSVDKHRPSCYIAMEIARPDTLENAVTERKLGPKDQKIVMQHIACGLRHIHQQGVVHAKLEPKHILQSIDSRHAKICGFARSRVGGKVFSITSKSTGVWGSPEVLMLLMGKNVGMDVTEKSDVYSAGLIFHYVMSDGKHPFGIDDDKRKYNIKKGKKAKIDLSKCPLDSTVTNLLQAMLSFDPKERPTAEDVLKHPFFWDEDVQRNCAKTVKKAIPVENLKRFLSNHKIINELDGCLLLYILYHKKELNTALTKLLKQGFDELPDPGLPKYSELVRVKFGENECPVVNTNFGLTFAEVQDPAGEIVQTESCGIYVKEQYKSEKSVFPAKMYGVVDDPAAVKIMQDTHEVRRSLEILQHTKNHENMVGVKRSFTIKTRVDVPGLSICSEEPAICVAMEPCDKSLADVLESSPSLQYRKMLMIHLTHALEFLQEKNVNHGKITADKLMLSKDGRYLKLLGSRKSSMVNKTAPRGDMLAAADILKIVVRQENRQSDRILDVELFDHLHDKMTDGASSSEILIHPFFWKPNKILDFFEAVGDHFDARDGNEMLEDHLLQCCEDDWSETLVLTAEEKQRWFSTDDDGIVYQKATAMKNKTMRKYDTTSRVWLVRFIRNCAHHLLEDCDKEKQENGYTEQQTLFHTRPDIWEFFFPRYPKLLHLLYTFIKDSKLHERPRFVRYFTEPAEKTSLDKVK